jgi:hypothetical protein
MSSHWLQLTDSAGSTFNIYLSTDNENWYTNDLGWLIYSGGPASSVSSEFGTLTDLDVWLARVGGDSLGLRLNVYENYRGTHSQGTGMVTQSWVLNLQPGPITWALVG